MSNIHLRDLPPLEDGIEMLAPMLNKIDPDVKALKDEWEWEDDAYSTPCRGIILGFLLGSVCWIAFYVLMLYFTGMS